MGKRETLVGALRLGYLRGANEGVHMIGWTGEERRSPESISARAAVSAKQQAEEFQAALQSLPRLRVAERRRLKRSLTDAREREHHAVSLLGGGAREPISTA